MVLLLTIPLRKVYGLQSFITMRHMHNMAKVMLATGLIVVYRLHDRSVFWLVQRQSVRTFHDLESHAWGRTRPYYWALILCNGITPQLLWFKKIRGEPAGAVADLVCREHRHVAGAIRDCRDQFCIATFLPSSWGFYQPTQWDWSMFIGTIGFFLALLFLFIRFLPMISIFEMRTNFAGGRG